MSNQLKMATIQTILSLRAQHWSFRRIAETLGVHRETVARYVRLAESKPSQVPAGNDGSCGPAPVGSEGAPTTGEPPPHATTPLIPELSRSGCEPWREVIFAKLAQSLSAQRIYQDLVAEHGFGGSYYSVSRFVRKLGAKTPLPFRRMECAPGQEAQVDFGTGAPLVALDGTRRKTHLFRIVLSHSRKAYGEVTFRQTAEDFLSALENAFWHFGGVPKTLIVDNLKAAVLHPDWFDPELNPKLQSFAQHYGTVILPTKPRTPRHKGKTERGVGYAQSNALKGRQFASLEEQNRFLLDWEASVADQRIHGTTRQQVGKLFGEVERAALLPLPRERFPFFHEAQRIVSRDGHVEVAKSYYTAPPEYLGRTVWARWDAHLVRIFNQRMEQIRVHTRQAPGKFSTHPDDIHPRKISGVERGAAWLLTKAANIGDNAAAWAAAMLQARGIEGVRVLQGLLAMSKRHPCDALDQACQTAISYNAFRLRTLRQLVKRGGAPQQPLPFLDEHPIIRPLSDYGGWVRDAFTRNGGRDHQGPRSLPPTPPQSDGSP
jgi:transposase